MDGVIFIVFLIIDLRYSNAEEEKADVVVKVLDDVAVATKAMDLIWRRRDHIMFSLWSIVELLVFVVQKYMSVSFLLWEDAVPT